MAGMRATWRSMREGRTLLARLLPAVLALVLGLASLPADPALAREIYALGGVDRSLDGNQGSYTWQLGFTQELTPLFAASFCYLNEGHLDNHRRDGYAAQIWARTDLLDRKLNLGAGIGPYLFFDTQRGATPGGFVNKHGWKGLASATATWRTDQNILFLLRGNYVAGESAPDTVSALAGIGYEFQPEGRDKTLPWERADNEVTFFLGQTIVNSLDSQRSVAMALEYRRTLFRHVDWTFTLMDEGDNRLIRRDGLVTQLWATQELHHNRATVGVGAGAYFDVKHYHSPGSRVSGIVTLSGSYRIARQWALRVSWHRVVTDYDRDTDVMLAGLGYRF